MGLSGFQPGQTQTDQCNHRRWLEAGNFGFMKYYPSSENKVADQLCSYCEADLWLCFRKYKTLVFS